MPQAPQAPTLGQTVARMNRTVPRLAAAGGRKGFKAELEELRERMRGLGLVLQQRAVMLCGVAA
jgi:hypothetical protein